MRVYQTTKENTLIKVQCNKCGKELKVVNNRVEEGVYPATKEWGYFSHKDGEVHSFDLCEECYDELIKTFKIPVEIQDNQVLI